jgi:hypothetical protein
MATDIEQLALDTLALNDGTNFVIESDMGFVAAEKKPQFIGNPDTDGEVLLEEAHYGNASFEFMLRAVDGSTHEAGRNKMDEFVQKLLTADRTEGGIPMTWIPTQSSVAVEEDPYTWYVLLGEIDDIPITHEGDGAGWFFKEPLVKVKLTCRPFGYRKEKVFKSATESAAAPQQEIYVKVGGHVPAEGRLVIADKATQTRRYLEWGREVVASESGNPSILIKADDLIITGYGAKEKKAVAGDWSTNSVYGIAVNYLEVACSTPVLSNVGSFRVKLRVQEVSASRSELRFRASCRVGDGPWGHPNAGQWSGPTPDWGTWCELDLGEVNLDKLDKGTQRCEIRIEVKVGAISSEYYIDYVGLIPTQSYGRARGAARIDVPSVVTAIDDMGGGGEGVTGTKLDRGGQWAGAGDAADFFRFTDDSKGGELFAFRTAVSDAAGIQNGRLITADGTTAMTDQLVSVSGYSTLDPSSLEMAWGVLARSDGTIENFLVAYMEKDTLKIAKRVAGVTTVLREVEGFNLASKTFHEITLGVLASGIWFVAFEENPGTSNSREILLMGHDAVLTTGGALDNGRVGFVDHREGATAVERYYKLFRAWVPSVPVVIQSGRSIEIRADAVERLDTGGAFWGRVPEYRGGFFYLDPEGEDGLYNRLVVRARRGDIVAEPDEAITDKQTIEVLARERVLYPLK